MSDSVRNSEMILANILFLLVVGGSSCGGVHALAPHPLHTKEDTAADNGHIKSVTAITQVFGDGQKVSAVAIEYDKDINNSKISLSDFLVSGRTVTKVYTNNALALTSQGTNGKYVIIELSPNDTNASTVSQNVGANQGSGQNIGVTSRANNTSNGPPMTSTISRKEVKLSVTQVGDIETTNGVTYPSNHKAIVNNKVINLVVDDFKQLEFQDHRHLVILSQQKDILDK
jgi:predicted peptidase